MSIFSKLKKYLSALGTSPITHEDSYIESIRVLTTSAVKKSRAEFEVRQNEVMLPDILQKIKAQATLGGDSTQFTYRELPSEARILREKLTKMGFYITDQSFHVNVYWGEKK